MTKSEMLKMLAEEYKKTIRLPDDISLRDYRGVIERETGIKISDSKATRTLNALKGFTSLLVVDRGKTIRVWRRVETRKRKSHESSRNAHRPTS